VAGMACSHCKKTLVDKEIPLVIAKQIKSVVFTRKNSLVMFSGVIIIALFSLIGLYTDFQSESKANIYLEQPAKNDLYVMNFSKMFEGVDSAYKYGVVRVRHINSEQLEFEVGRLVYNPTICC
jgi:hypothetical protein